jgi:hypothetical protein
VSKADLGATFVAWAQRERTVRALVMIGSRVREPDVIGAADEFSDWDFQVLTTDSSLLSNRQWMQRAGLPDPLAFITRSGRLSRGIKATAIFPHGEIDLVLLPHLRLRTASLLVRLNLARRLPTLSAALGELALVLRPGYRVLKDSGSWTSFLDRVVRDFAPKPLSDEAIIALAEGFVADYTSTRSKLRRGELLAAQRWLHHQLAETNFRLLHELRLRASETSFPDARRVEFILPQPWLEAVSVSAVLERTSLEQGLEKSAETLRRLVKALVNDRWRWPDLLSRLRVE